MINFLEYSHNLEQIIAIIQKMSKNNASSNIAIIKSYIPVEFMDKLPDTARAEMANLLLNIIDDNPESWDRVGNFLHALWDQPISKPGKTLGKELLNCISAQVMLNIGAEFFISYSGDLSKGAVYRYTNKHPRVFISKSNYRWGAYSRVFSTLSGDYAKHFNNNRELQK